jgi:hypothetical protein
LYDPDTAAEMLLKALALPRSQVSVWPWRENGDVVLCVMVDPSYRGVLTGIPSQFLGYKVSIEARTTNVALAR